VKRSNDREKPKPQELARAFPEEERTSANAAACRRRFGEHRDEIDRRCLRSLERSRSGRSSSSHRSGITTVTSDGSFVPPSSDAAAVLDRRSLAQLFRVQDVDAVVAMPSVPDASCCVVPNVFDLIDSDSSDADSSDADSSDRGTLLLAEALPWAALDEGQRLGAPETPSVPGLVRRRPVDAALRGRIQPAIAASLPRAGGDADVCRLTSPPQASTR
jgi:hypothetical protein